VGLGHGFLLRAGRREAAPDGGGLKAGMLRFCCSPANKP
jgi:hypothetical protein